MTAPSLETVSVYADLNYIESPALMGLLRRQKSELEISFRSRPDCRGRKHSRSTPIWLDKRLGQSG
jgi:hypothetical protein